MTFSEAEIEIKRLLDKDFLAKLKEIAKLYGWNGDYTEIKDFVSYLYSVHGIEITQEELEPYDLKDNI